MSNVLTGLDTHIHPFTFPSLQPFGAQLLPVSGQFHGIFSRVLFQPFPGVLRASEAAILGNAPADQPDIIFPQVFQVSRHSWGTAFEIGEDPGHDPLITLPAALLDLVAADPLRKFRQRCTARPAFVTISFFLSHPG